jgi:hypothetical protein
VKPKKAQPTDKNNLESTSSEECSSDSEPDLDSMTEDARQEYLDKMRRIQF